MLESVINVNEVQPLMMIDLPKSRIGDQDGKRIADVGGTILMCVIHGLVNKEKGLKYLESLKPVIRDKYMFYIKAKSRICDEYYH